MSVIHHHCCWTANEIYIYTDIGDGLPDDIGGVHRCILLHHALDTKIGRWTVSIWHHCQLIGLSHKTMNFMYALHTFSKFTEDDCVFNCSTLMVQTLYCEYHGMSPMSVGLGAQSILITTTNTHRLLEYQMIAPTVMICSTTLDWASSFVLFTQQFRICLHARLIWSWQCQSVSFGFNEWNTHSATVSINKLWPRLQWNSL